MKTKTTHQATAQVPVSSEWTSDTERFLHFHVLQGSVSTMLGLGTVCRNLWRILKVTEQNKTYRAGCFCTSFSHVSILHTLFCVSSFLGQRVLLMLFPWWSKLSVPFPTVSTWIAFRFLKRCLFSSTFSSNLPYTQALCIYSPPSHSFLHVLVPVIGVVSVTVPVCSTLIGWWWICLWECYDREWRLYLPWTFCVHLPVFHNQGKTFVLAVKQLCQLRVKLCVCVWVSEWMSEWGSTIEQ